MTYFLDIKNDGHQGCKRMISRWGEMVEQEFHVPVEKVDIAISEWETLMAKSGHQYTVVRHDVN